MGLLEAVSRRLSPGAKATVLLAAFWAFFLSQNDPFALAMGLATRLARSVLTGSAQQAIYEAIWDGSRHLFLGMPTFALLVAATLALPLAALGRVLSRARVRAGFEDPVDRVRAWTVTHPRLMRFLVGLPALHWLFGALRGLLRTALHEPRWDAETALTSTYALAVAFVGCVAAAMAVGIFLLTRAGVRATLAARPRSEPAAPLDDRIRFDAVAVTVETRAAVGAMALLPVATIVGLNMTNAGGVVAAVMLAAYVATAGLGAYAFVRSSKVAIGVDGVFVTGSSRTRFIPYTALDDARANGHDVELLRSGRVVLRLQLHGEDVALKGSLLARLQDGIAKAAAPPSDGAGHVVATASASDLARLAEGATDYRTAAVTREQLWGLVEGATQGGETRTEAARALAATSRAGDRTRLRVAAGHCAEPGVRVRLEELATTDSEELMPDDAPRLQHAR